MAVKRWDGIQWVDTVGIYVPSGVINPYAGITAPSGWLLCDGTAYSRTAYSNLFSTLCPTLGVVTITIATPGVVTLASHGMITGDAIYLTTTGALPTGLTANTIYYVSYISTSTFALSTTYANAIAGTRIATSGTQSGIHTLIRSPHGLGDGSTTFNIPDLRGRTIAGTELTASRITTAEVGYTANLGYAGGIQAVGLAASEIPAHYHSFAWQETSSGANDLNPIDAGYGNPGGIQWGVDTSTTPTDTFYVITTGGYQTSAQNVNAASGTTRGGSPAGAALAGTGATHNNIQPTAFMNYIIKV